MIKQTQKKLPVSQLLYKIALIIWVLILLGYYGTMFFVSSLPPGTIGYDVQIAFAIGGLFVSVGLFVLSVACVIAAFVINRLNKNK
jgi:hypothetical protein